jgi:protein glucosyltransferase
LQVPTISEHSSEIDALYSLIPEANKYLKLIQDAVSTYKPCSQENCSCHASVIEKDLSPFKSGITKDMINSVKDK